MRPGVDYCKQCKPIAVQALATFKSTATGILWSAGPTGPSWDQCVADLTATGVPVEHGLEEIEEISADWLRRFASLAVADQVIDDQEWRDFWRAARILVAPDEVVDSLAAEFVRVNDLATIRSGNLPRLPAVGLHLDNGEICHLDTSATLTRFMARGPQPIPGRLLLTSKKMRFVAATHGAELAWAKILSVVAAGPSLTIETSGRALAGPISLPDAERALAIADTLVRLDRRQLLPGAMGQRDTRTIPQHVRTAVWQRDGGRCVQCRSDSFMEYDHVIPLSLGGATSEANLQLLCRACNLAKGARI